MPQLQPLDLSPSPPSGALLASAGDRCLALAPVGAPQHEDEPDGVAFNAPWLVHFRGGEVAIEELSQDTEAHVTASQLDAGDDLIVVFDLKAPGVTDKASLTDAQQGRALRKRKVRVISPFVRSGGTTLHHAGPPARERSGDERMMYWSLSGAENKTGRRSPSGEQTLAFTAGERTVGTLRLHWDNDR